MDYKSRLQKIKQLLKEKKLDAALITSVPNITYFTGYSGFSTEEREAYLIITNHNNYLITDGRYITAVKKEVDLFSFCEITSNNSLQNILEKIKTSGNILCLGIEEESVSVIEYKILIKVFNQLQDLPINGIRTIKSLAEIELIKEACRIGDSALKELLFRKIISAGISEKEISQELELYIKRSGGELSFKTIVAFGANAAVPHHHTGETKLKHNNIILLDFGVKYKNYCSDMTRTIFFGSAKAEFKKMYNTVKNAQHRAIEFLISSFQFPNSNSKFQNNIRTMEQLNNGKSVNKINAWEVDNVSRQYIINKGFPTIPHSLGHGIGLEVHEEPRLSPNSKDILKPGMVFSVEPGIYIPNFGGVRIEDLVVLTENGIEVITHSPRNIIELP